MRALVVALAFVLAACGTVSTPVSQSSNGVSPSDSRSSAVSSMPTATPAPSPSLSPSPAVTAACPATIRNISGHYSVTCPTGWTFLSCEETNFYSPYTWLINPETPCRQEAYGARLFVISFSGPHDPAGYLGSLQSSQNVRVAAVDGTRKVYLVTASNPLPPPKDTVQVLYTFMTGGRTYYLEYDRYPGDPDATANFDRMVTRTLAFST